MSSPLQVGRSTDQLINSPTHQLINSSTHQMLGLYIHIPFCSAICNYCNFNRGLFDESLKVRYVDALVAEITRAGGAGQAGRGGGSRRADVGDGLQTVPAADTIYFGGGTPSLLEPAEVHRIIDACRGSFDLT